MPDISRQPEINIGATGHVDHGKTTLVEGLTGVWTSSHSEELRRGITIKVGYADVAFYKCESCPPPGNYFIISKCPTCKNEAKLLRVVSFVDAPGHESLMANTLSGASLMDGSLLVIAANEKVPQPQTREHLIALQMLGMKHIVIAQNKIDLIDDAQALSTYQNIKSLLKNTVAEKSPIIPISAQHKINIDSVIESIEKYIPTPKRDLTANPLMHVLRSFDVNKPGLDINAINGGVVGGSILKGKLKVGDEVEFKPGILDISGSNYHSINTKILTIATSAGLVDEASPGGLIALGTSLDPSITKSDSLLGCVIGKVNELPEICNSINLEYNLFDSAIGSEGLLKVDQITKNENLRINSGTAISVGKTSLIKNGSVTIDLKKPICAEPNSRVAISRRIGGRWRLIGSGSLK